MNIDTSKLDWIESQTEHVRKYPDYAAEAMGKIIQAALQVLRDITKEATS